MKKKPTILYHYTSVETLLKIIENSNTEKICFRATHARFFNDPYEYNLAISLLKQSLVKYEKNNSIENKKSSNFNKRFFTNLGLIFGDPFLFSLSENSDNLAMWRTYGVDVKGVAIGLDKKMLEEYSKVNNLCNNLPTQSYFSIKGSTMASHGISIFIFFSLSFSIKNLMFPRIIPFASLGMVIVNGMSIPSPVILVCDFLKNICGSVSICNISKADSPLLAI